MTWSQYGRSLRKCLDFEKHPKLQHNLKKNLFSNLNTPAIETKLPNMSQFDICRDSYESALSIYSGYPKDLEYAEELQKTKIQDFKLEQTFPDMDTFLTTALSPSVIENTPVQENQLPFIQENDDFEPEKIISKEEIALMMINFTTKYKEYGTVTKKIVRTPKLNKVLSLKNLDSIDRSLMNADKYRLSSPSTQNYLKIKIKLDPIVGEIYDVLESNVIIVFI